MSLTPALFTSQFADGPDTTKFRPSDLNNITGLLTRLLDGADTHGSVAYRSTVSNDGLTYAPSAAGVLACAGAGQAPAFRALTSADVPDLSLTYVPTTRTINGYALSSNVSLVKADVGLGNVENTALSTWAGSTALTTLGTLSTLTMAAESWVGPSSTTGVYFKGSNVGIGTITPNYLGANVASRVLSIAGTGAASNRNARIELVNPKTPAEVGDESGRIHFINPANGDGSVADMQSAQILSNLRGAGGTHGFAADMLFYVKPNSTASVVEVFRLSEASVGALFSTPIMFSGDNARDIGATASGRPKSVYIGTSLTVPTATLSGAMDAASYKVGGVAGVNFGPAHPSSITVVNGIITAAS